MKVRLLLSTQRSGSHFLKSFIETRFSDIICSEEVLGQPLPNVTRIPSLFSKLEILNFWPWYERQAATGKISVSPDKRMKAFEAYLTKLCDLLAPRDLVVDIKYNSVRTLSGYWDSDHGSHDFTSFIASRDIPVLHLIRKNVLCMLVSAKLAEELGVWHRAQERRPNEVLPRIKLNPKALLFDIRYSLQLTQDYQNRFSGYPNYEEIIYESFVREQNAPLSSSQVRTLAHFLGQSSIQSGQKEIPYKKTTPEELHNVVDNWDEIVRVLRGTEYEWMAETPLCAAA